MTSLYGEQSGHAAGRREVGGTCHADEIANRMKKKRITGLNALTERFIFTLAELVRVVVGVMSLRSKVRVQLVYSDGHLTGLQV